MRWISLADELDSPYLEEEQLDLKAWARDALALALPSQIVCRDECKGLCSICGENLNTAGLPSIGTSASPTRAGLRSES